MEESLEAVTASGDSPSGVATTSTAPNFGELLTAYKLLEEQAYDPGPGLPFVDRPQEALAAQFGERALLIVDELWARGAIIVVGQEEGDTLFERALILAEPSEDDRRKSVERYWERTTVNVESAEADETTTRCLVPGIEACADDGSDASPEAAELEEDNEDGEEAEQRESPTPPTTIKDMDGVPRPPARFALFRDVLPSALAHLIAVVDEDSHVLHPLDELRGVFDDFGIRGFEAEMGFVNWLTVSDLIHILVPGPRVILILQAARDLLKILRNPPDLKTKVAKAPAKKYDAGEHPLLAWRGKKFSLQLQAMALATLLTASDDRHTVTNVVDLLTPVVEALGEPAGRVPSLLDKLTELGFLVTEGKNLRRVTPEGIEFVEEQRRLVERALQATEAAGDELAVTPAQEVDAPADMPDEVPEDDDDHPPPDTSDAPRDKVSATTDETGSVDAAAAEPTSDADGVAPAHVPSMVEDVVEARDETAEAPPCSPSSNPPSNTEEPAPATHEQGDAAREVRLTEGARSIMREYLRDKPTAQLGEVLSELILAHLGPEVARLETAIELSFQILWQRRSREKTWRGRPAAFTPQAILAAYPPHLAREEADRHLRIMQKRGWIRWVYPRKDPLVGRRPQSYIALLRDP